MDKRYKGLRIIGTLYKVLGIIMLSITVLVVIGVCGMSILGGAVFEGISREFSRETGLTGLFGGAFAGLTFAFVVILYGGIISLTTYAFGEGIYLLLAMEENTRSSAMLLQRQLTHDVPTPVASQSHEHPSVDLEQPTIKPEQDSGQDDEEIPPTS